MKCPTHMLISIVNLFHWLPTICKRFYISLPFKAIKCFHVFSHSTYLKSFINLRQNNDFYSFVLHYKSFEQPGCSSVLKKLVGRLIQKNVCDHICCCSSALCQWRQSTTSRKHLLWRNRIFIGKQNNGIPNCVFGAREQIAEQLLQKYRNRHKKISLCLQDTMPWS